MADVLLVTCAELPEGEPGGKLLVDELAARGIAARWVRWDDRSVAWRAARLVTVRSTWDYDQRRDEFLAWARSVGPRLMNGAEVFAWNTDKAYLVHLGQSDLPVVPTAAVDELEQLGRTVAELAPAVVKPRVGAGGRGVVVFPEPPSAQRLVAAGAGDGPWVVQPLVPSVRTEGETSVFVLGGDVVSQVRKVPGPSSDGAEIRVHEEFGGTTRAVPVSAEAAQLATDTVRTAEELVGARLPYARVDLMRLPVEHGGVLAVSELEVTEPGLYLDVVPANAERFAALVEDLLDGSDEPSGSGQQGGRRGGCSNRATPAETPSHPRGELRLGPGGIGGQWPVWVTLTGLDLVRTGPVDPALHSGVPSAKKWLALSSRE